ncbi:DsbC family protein [Moraxella sp. ZY210820]|uniref:DsbC family protein n=1 Tax=unclassified Moraxella TaxID=2685852 RepID=UPI00273115D1|nr:DsbC family protein [Moraxella sp. ZY210820]WLF83834.1 DsbC family protein [Moraxella sp. ZY210820]
MKIKTLSLSLLIASIALVGCKQEQTTEKVSLTASAPAGEASTLTETNAIQRLQTTLEQHFKTANLNVKITEIKAIPNSNFYWVILDNHTSIYATADGSFVLQGDLLRLGGKQVENVSENFRADINKKALATLNDKDLIIYPAKGTKKHTIYVFSDVSCSYCQRLHRQMEDMNAKGIEVRYIAWPRGEQLFPAMESIWCSDDRKKAFDDVMNGVNLPPATCTNPVRTQFELGQQMGVSGTPAIFTEDGRQIGGYLGVDDLIKAINQK